MVGRDGNTSEGLPADGGRGAAPHVPSLRGHHAAGRDRPGGHHSCSRHAARCRSVRGRQQRQRDGRARIGDAGRGRAAVGERRAARVEPAAVRDARRVRRLALEQRRPIAPRVAAVTGHGQQRLRVRVPRVRQHLLGRPDLDDPAEVHDGDAVGDVPRQPEIVRDHEHRQAHLVAQPQQQRQDLAADRGVERGHRLVGDDHRRVQRERAGDDDALALAAGQLVRVAEEEPLRRPQSGPGQRVRDQLSPRCRGSCGSAGPRRRPRRPTGAGSARRSGPAARAARCGGRRAAPSSSSRAAGPGSGCRRSVGFSRPSIVRASVVLPQPDSPASATISPGRIGGSRRRPPARRIRGADPDR